MTDLVMPGYVCAEENAEVRKAVFLNLARESHKKLGICEQLRFVYDSVYQLPDGTLKKLLTEQLIDAFLMAKKINSRLVHYYKKYNDGTGHGGKNIKYLKHTDKRRELRLKRTYE